MSTHTKKSGFAKPLAKLFAAAVVVFGAVVGGQAVAATGIAGSKHNLSSSSSFNKLDGFTEICVFCHTPHAASTTVSAP